MTSLRHHCSEVWFFLCLIIWPPQLLHAEDAAHPLTAIVGQEKSAFTVLDHPEKLAPGLTLIAHDPVSTLALVQPSTALAAQLIGSSRALQPGDICVATTSPERRVSAHYLGRLTRRQSQPLRLHLLEIEAPLTTLAVLPTGTPFFNTEGKLVGLSAEKARAIDATAEANNDQALGRCALIPVEAAVHLLRCPIRDQRFASHELNFGLEANQSLPRLAYVKKDALAARLGLRVGDVIIRLSEQTVTSVEDVLDRCYYLDPTQTAAYRFTVLRAGQPLTLPSQP
jgi:S1-C subfamily serine protease